MEFELTQKKFQYLLEKLIVKDMFPISILSMKNGKMFSIQKEDDKRAFRLLKFNKSFFNSISGVDESFEFDIKKIHKMIKGIPSTALLKIKTTNDIMSITGKGIDFVFSCNKLGSEVMTSLPFSFENNIPVVTNEKIKLDMCFKIGLSNFKNAAGYATTMKTNMFKLFSDNGSVSMRVGDLYSFSDYITLDMNVKTNDTFDVIFNYGLKQISKTFDNDINICTKTNAAGWFYELSGEHVLGILIPPCIKEEGA